MKNINKFTKPFILICLLFGLPILGLSLSGQSIGRFLEFPPMANYVQHHPFSWTMFIILAVLIFLAALPFFIMIIRALKRFPIKSIGNYKIPWWGKIGFLSLIFFWIIAWTHFDLPFNIRFHTFFPLWLSYILVVNALHYKKSGECLITRNIRKFLSLFPVSAVFWWYFEYLNSFSGNWHYIDTDYNPLNFFLLSTLSFSTVLPAVTSTSNLLSSYSWIDKGFKGIFAFKIANSKTFALTVLILSCIGLMAIGIFPDYLFPLVWLSPFMIIVSIKTLINERHLLSGISYGNWSPVVSAALAALICGIFWEMWNYYSLPKWQYSIPFINKIRIFEMPILGYAGYIPFGLLCIAISEIVLPNNNRYK